MPERGACNNQEDTLVILWRHFYCSTSSWADSSTQRNRSSEGELTAQEEQDYTNTSIHSLRNTFNSFFREYKQHQALHFCQELSITLWPVVYSLWKWMDTKFLSRKFLADWLTSREIWRLMLHNRVTDSVFTRNELSWEHLFRFISVEHMCCADKFA